jgi:hypothetical protein
MTFTFEELKKLDLKSVDYKKYYGIILFTLHEHVLLLKNVLNDSYEDVKARHSEIEITKKDYENIRNKTIEQFNDTMSALMVTYKLNHEKFHNSEQIIKGD